MKALRLPSLLRWRNTNHDTKVAVMGALRSGTNLVAAVVEKHWTLSADFHAYGWKHAGAPIFGPSSGLSYPDLPIVWISKHPYALTASLHRYLISARNGRGISLKGALDLRDFLRSPITILDSQLPGSPQLRFANPVQYWNFITWNLETLDPGYFPALAFNYEDILSDPGVLCAVERLPGVKLRQHGPIALPEGRMGRGKYRPIEGDSRFEPARYMSRQYLTEFDADDLAFMAREVDPWLMQRRGYTTEVIAAPPPQMP